MKVQRCSSFSCRYLWALLLSSSVALAVAQAEVPSDTNLDDLISVTTATADLGRLLQSTSSSKSGNSNNSTYTNGTLTDDDNKESRVNIPSDEHEVASIQLDYLFFPHVDWTETAAPTLDVYQSLACQTDAYFTHLLQDKMGTVLRLSLRITEWEFTPPSDDQLPVFRLVFEVHAFFDDRFVYDMELDLRKVIAAMEIADFRDYVTNYAWLSYPIDGESTAVLRGINRLAYDGSAVLAGSKPILYDTTTCPSDLTQVESTWHFGFFDQSGGMALNELDIEALVCQMRSYVEASMSTYNYGARIQATLRQMEWTYDEEANPDFPLQITVDIVAALIHHNGDTTHLSPSDVTQVLKGTEGIMDFIEHYVYKTPASTDVFLDTQQVKVEANVRNIAAEYDTTGGWTSDDVCPAREGDSTPAAAATSNPMPDVTRPPRPAPAGGATSNPMPDVTRPPRPADNDNNNNNGDVTRPPRPADSDNEQPGNGDADGGDVVGTGDEPAAFLKRCRMALLAADQDGNNQLSHKEYLQFLNAVWGDEFEGYPFVALPTGLRDNYDAFSSSSGELNLDVVVDVEPAARAGNIFARNSNSNKQVDTRQQQLDQEEHRDAICQATQLAVLAAPSLQQAKPVRLEVLATFLAYNQAGMTTTDEFWSTGLDVKKAFDLFLKEHVANGMDEVLLGARQRQRQRRYLRGSSSRRRVQTTTESTTASNDPYWVETETASIKAVQPTDCPAEGVPGDASCFRIMAAFDVIALTDDPNDESLTKPIADAAAQAAESGIEKGELQSALQGINPESPWVLQADPTAASFGSAEQATTDNNGEGEGGDSPPVNGTLSNTQCGGDIGEEALELVGQDCDSFAGQNFWHIIVIVCLVVFLGLLALPICIWGRYPCCGPKREAGVSVNKGPSNSENKRRPSQLMDIALGRASGLSGVSSHSRDSKGSRRSRGSGRSLPGRSLSKEKVDELRQKRAERREKEFPFMRSQSFSGDRPPTTPDKPSSSQSERPRRQPPRRTTSMDGDPRFDAGTAKRARPRRAPPRRSKSMDGDPRVGGFRRAASGRSLGAQSLGPGPRGGGFGRAASGRSLGAASLGPGGAFRRAQSGRSLGAASLGLGLGPTSSGSDFRRANSGRSLGAAAASQGSSKLNLGKLDSGEPKRRGPKSVGPGIGFRRAGSGRSLGVHSVDGGGRREVRGGRRGGPRRAQSFDDGGAPAPSERPRPRRQRPRRTRSTDTAPY